MKKIFVYPVVPESKELFIKTGYYFDGLNYQDTNLENINTSDYIGIGTGNKKLSISNYGKIKSAYIVLKNNIPNFLKTNLEKHINNYPDANDESWLVIYSDKVEKLDEDFKQNRYTSENFNIED